MRKILVANPKGGCGKSTIAVHLASWFAMHDEVVYIGDLDRQQSSRQWLEMRPPELPPIRHWEPSEDLLAPPKDCSVAIFDTPAGLHGKRLKQLLDEVDRVIVPVSPSRFDMLASRDFFDELAQIKAVRKDRVGIGIVGMRVDARATSTHALVEFLEQFDLPLLTCLRSTQRYVRALESGLTLLESNEAAAAIDRLQWHPLLEWLITRRAA